MDKQEYKRLAAKERTKHIKLPSGLELDLIAPLPAEITDALIRNNIDIARIQEVGKRSDKDGGLSPQDAADKEVLRFTQVVARMIVDSDGEHPTDYLIGDDYQAFVQQAMDFFTHLPTVTPPHTT